MRNLYALLSAHSLIKEKFGGTEQDPSKDCFYRIWLLHIVKVGARERRAILDILIFLSTYLCDYLPAHRCGRHVLFLQWQRGNSQRRSRRSNRLYLTTESKPRIIRGPDSSPWKISTKFQTGGQTKRKVRRGNLCHCRDGVR